MTNDDKWLYIEGVIADMMTCHDKFMAVVDAIQAAPESPLVDSFWKVEGNLLDTLSLLVNDNFENFQWFVIECDFGRSPHEAGMKGNMRLIDSIEKLRWLVELNSEK